MSIRSEAKAAGQKRYCTGVPCPHGHKSDRWTSNGRCVVCSMASYRAYYGANKDHLIKSNREWKDKNYAHYLKSRRDYMRARYAAHRTAVHA